MIKKTKIDVIENLLRSEGLSQRQIAKLLGVSRGTVHAIAHGRRIIKDRQSQCNPFIAPKGPPERCPFCGANVQMPCLACQIFGLGNKRMEA